MSAFDPGPDGALFDPRRGVVDALADLAALVRGGGRPGTTPDGLADDFARAVAALLGSDPMVVDVRDDGLYADGQPLWAHDLLARRVAVGLRDQGLRAFAIEPAARHKALRGLALVLTRDWKKQGDGALKAMLEGRRLPGVQLDFEDGGASRGLPALEPRSALEALRADAGDEHPQLGPILARLRDELGQPGDLAGAIEGVGIGARTRLQHELAAITAGADATVQDIGRVAFETMRLDSSGLQAADTFRLVVDHFEQLVATGRVGEALALLRPCLVLVDPETMPDWSHQELLTAELGSLFLDEVLARLVASASSSQAAAEWPELLLLLGRACPEERRLALCEAAGGLPRDEHRQAIADGLLLGSTRPVEDLALLLARAQGGGVAIVLLGLSRLDTPKLLEKILARMDSPEALVREAALKALRKHRTPHTSERVRGALLDEDEAVRVEALRYLTVYRDAEAARVILGRLEGSQGVEIAPGEARALGISYALIARQEGLEPLRRVARSAAASRPEAARAAAYGLHALGMEGRTALAELARDNAELRRHAREVEGGQP